MAILDKLTRLASRPAGRVVEAPVRDLVQEALAGSELASAAELTRLQGQVDAARSQLAILSERSQRLEHRLAELIQENDRLRAELQSRPAARHRPEPKAPAAPSPEVKARPSSTCKVRDCGNTTRSKGFCQKHYRSWRGGELPGFVGPEGRVVHLDRELRVDAEYQGLPVTVTGRKRFTVKVAGTKVPFS